MKVEIDLAESVAKRLKKIAKESNLDLEDVVKIAAVQFVTVPVVPQVLSPAHVYWSGFIEILAARIIDVAKDGEQYIKCDGSYRHTEDILSVFKRFGVSLELTMEFFKKNGLCCDCAILELSQLYV